MKELNQQQQIAVDSNIKRIFVLAGAGAGKTRVITHRVNRLIVSGKSYISNILMLTFTKKAAVEMKTRIFNFGHNTSNLWIGTFHRVANQILFNNLAEANLASDYQIINESDQLKILKRLAWWNNPYEIGVDDCRSFINRCKEFGLRPNHPTFLDLSKAQKIFPCSRNQLTLLNQMYFNYSLECQKLNLIDYGEILLRCVELLSNNSTILQMYQMKFEHVFVDEFQDTNEIQYQLLRLLATQNVFFVGDDDQKIYGWRGASLNLFDAISDFDMDIIKLEQNYRSTQPILDCSNLLISNNEQRFGKKLWTTNLTTKKPIFHECDNSFDESEWICHRLKPKGNAAILVRLIEHIRILENTLISHRIPYQIVNGLKLFSRMEILDVIAYLKIIENIHNTFAMERIINVPHRGIGQVTISKIMETAKESGYSMWDVLIRNTHKQKIKDFVELVMDLIDVTYELPLHQRIEKILDVVNLVKFYEKDKKVDPLFRLRNIHEFMSICEKYIENNGENSITTFINELMLNEIESPEQNECVQIMTVHSAKGLEFDTVFICGLEETVFPHINNPDMEEERRLFYVGITRARKELFLTSVKSRNAYGDVFNNPISRFINEISESVSIT